MPAHVNSGPTLSDLLRQREEVERWLEGPVKKAMLTAIKRQIAGAGGREGGTATG